LYDIWITGHSPEPLTQCYHILIFLLSESFNMIAYIFNASIYMFVNLYSVLQTSGWLSNDQVLFSFVTTSTDNTSMMHKPRHYV
jgi:hypothetical protein